MYKITIGIPTYKRPVMLEKLLERIFSNNIDSSLLRHVDIVVVDNDAEKSAEAIIARWISNHSNSFFHLHYFNYPIKGLANVRNEMLKRALLLEPDYIAFIDDDEYPSLNWLNELVRTIANNKADFALGPVVPDFETKVSSGIAERFKCFDFEDNHVMEFIYSGNLIMRPQFIKEQQLEFDPQFNSMGAEDTYFGVSALNKGATILWAKKAIVYETIPAKRATLNWVFKRMFRGANTFMYILMKEKKYAKIIKKIIISFFYLIFGLLAMILMPFNLSHRYYGILKIAESLGSFAALLNINYQEYLKGR